MPDEAGYCLIVDGPPQQHPLNRIGISLAGECVLHIIRNDDGIPWRSHAGEPLELFARLPDGREIVLTLTAEVITSIVPMLRTLGLPIEERPAPEGFAIGLGGVNGIVVETEAPDDRT